MHILIIANGWYNPPSAIPPHDLLIAADGGARRCLENLLKPDYVVGDLDSLDATTLAALEALGAHILQYPTRKDFTDLELALQLAAQLGADQVTLLAALGERWDMTSANILLCAAQTAFKISILDGEQALFFLHSGEQLEVQAAPGRTVSLIPLSPSVQGIRTHNLEYPLQREELVFGSTRGVSNVLLASPAMVSIEQGLLLVTVNHAAQ